MTEHVGEVEQLAPTNPAASDDGVVDGLAGWLEPRLGKVQVAGMGQPGSGYSSTNLIVETTTLSGDKARWVLRRDSLDAAPYPEQVRGLGTGVALQHRVMTGLRRFVPVAETLELETDPTVIGVPFFVMRWVDGAVPIEMPPCTSEGFYAEGTPELRAAMAEHGLAALAALHAADWRTGPLSALLPVDETPDAARQLRLWREHLELGLRGRTATVLDRTLAALQGHTPNSTTEPVLVWGDARLGNVIWDGVTGGIRALTDFEGAAIGDRELDLGWWLMADRWLHEGSGIERLPGEPTREQQKHIYERHAGRETAELSWFELFAAFRFAVTVVHVMNRWETSGLLNDDHTIWYENPATQLCALIMKETGAT